MFGWVGNLVGGSGRRGEQAGPFELRMKVPRDPFRRLVPEMPFHVPEKIFPGSPRKKGEQQEGAPGHQSSTLNFVPSRAHHAR